MCPRLVAYSTQLLASANVGFSTVIFTLARVPWCSHLGRPEMHDIMEPTSSDACATAPTALIVDSCRGLKAHWPHRMVDSARGQYQCPPVFLKHEARRLFWRNSVSPISSCM